MEESIKGEVIGMFYEKFFMDYCWYVNRGIVFKSLKMGLVFRSWKVRKRFFRDLLYGVVVLL